MILNALNHNCYQWMVSVFTFDCLYTCVSKGARCAIACTGAILNYHLSKPVPVIKGRIKNGIKT